ncbi:DUF2971 domain-containing protein [Streptomyces sp. NPDC002156]
MVDSNPAFSPDWLMEIEGIPTRGEMGLVLDLSIDLNRAETVYHYTSAAGLLGIISSEHLWATDVEFLNDAQELTYAGERLLHALQAERETVRFRELVAAGNVHTAEIANEFQSREERREYWGCHKDAGSGNWGLLEAIDTIIEGLKQMRGPSRTSPLHAYVSCFCQDGDLLSQWRGYGGVGGYSIGFNTHTLRNMAYRFEKGEFRRITYGFDLAVKFERDEFFPEYLHSGITLLGDYLTALTMIKNPAFREEREWRLMIPRDELRDDVGFRVGPVGVTPYLQVDFPLDAMTKVIVGPGQHHAERMNGTRQLLRRYGMSHVDVVPSTTSLRL